MDDSKDGVVYFTLGSMVIVESLMKEQILSLYASFAKISPVRVLIKIKDQTKLPPGLPDNVRTMSWIPQIPVLCKYHEMILKKIITIKKRIMNFYNYR